MTDQQLIICLSAALAKANKLLEVLELEMRINKRTEQERQTLALLQSFILDNDKLVEEVVGEQERT